MICWVKVLLNDDEPSVELRVLEFATLRPKRVYIGKVSLLLHDECCKAAKSTELWFFTKHFHYYFHHKFYFNATLINFISRSFHLTRTEEKVKEEATRITRSV